VRASVAIALLWATSLVAQPAPGVARPRPMAITGATIVDVQSGQMLRDRTVIIRGSRIATVGPRASTRLPLGARVIDGRGRYLIPGLWDMHVHNPEPGAEAMLPGYLAYGVTGVRDMGADLLALRAHRDRITVGGTIGPRIVLAGPILDGPLGRPMPAAHGSWRIEVTQPARARRLVDSLVAAGADFIKVHERLDADVHRAIMMRARTRGVAVAGHAPTAVGAAAAAEAGQRTIEHLVNVPFACTDAERSELRPTNGLEALLGGCATDDPVALMRVFVDRGTWHVPTLVVQQRVALGPGVSRGDPGLRHVPMSVRELLRSVGPLDLPAPRGRARERFTRFFEKRVSQVGQMHAAGVRLLVGSDAPGVAPGWSVHEEMRLFVRAGIPPIDALRAATINPARMLAATDSLGSVAEGKLADLVLLDADPLEDIRNTLRVRAVLAGGRFYDRAALDAILQRSTAR
jgi:imidazolonepropionase-like amidohydrolase